MTEADVIPARQLVPELCLDFVVPEDAAAEQLVGDRTVFDAGIALLTRTGADEVFVRLSADQKPTAWVVSARWGEHWESTAGNTAEQAMVRMLQDTVDGGLCSHCRKVTGIARDFRDDLTDDHVCWYQFDPELKLFRRSCEGEE